MPSTRSQAAAAEKGDVNALASQTEQLSISESAPSSTSKKLTGTTADLIAEVDNEDDDEDDEDFNPDAEVAESNTEDSEQGEDEDENEDAEEEEDALISGDEEILKQRLPKSLESSRRGKKSAQPKEGTIADLADEEEDEDDSDFNPDTEDEEDTEDDEDGDDVLDSEEGDDDEDEEGELESGDEEILKQAKRS